MASLSKEGGGTLCYKNKLRESHHVCLYLISTLWFISMWTLAFLELIKVILIWLKDRTLKNYKNYSHPFFNNIIYIIFFL